MHYVAWQENDLSGFQGMGFVANGNTDSSLQALQECIFRGLMQGYFLILQQSKKDEIEVFFPEKHLAGEFFGFEINLSAKIDCVIGRYVHGI